MIAAHDDDSVNEEEFLELAVEWSAATARLPAAERVEAALQVHDHAAGALLGRRVRAIAVGPTETRPTPRPNTKT